jgi:hypothetical protein
MTETPQQMFKPLRRAPGRRPRQPGWRRRQDDRRPGRGRPPRAVIRCVLSDTDAVDIGQIRPLIPLQVDPPGHRAPQAARPDLRTATDRHVDTTCARSFGEVDGRRPQLQLSRIDRRAVADHGVRSCWDCRYRAAEFIELKNGIIRPQASPEQHEAVASTGAKIYAVLRSRRRARAPDIRLHLDVPAAEVDGERLTHEDVLDIGYLFFLAGLDTVTASLDRMIAHLAKTPSTATDS